jgi:uncharacterized protein
MGDLFPDQESFQTMTELQLMIAGGVAVGAGFVNALAGGGTLLTFPTLTALGIPPVAANITNTIALCPGYLGGALAQRQSLGGIRRKLLYIFGLAAALGGVAGGYLLLQFKEETFRTLVPYLILLAAGLLVMEGPVRRWSARHADRNGDGQEHDLWKAVPVLLASIYGGYFGGGLSVIVLGVLTLVLHEPLTRLNALKQLIALCANVAAAIFLVFSNKVVWPAAIVMAVGALIGGAIGGRAAEWVRPAALRAIVVLLAVAVAIVYFVR